MLVGPLLKLGFTRLHARTLITGQEVSTEKQREKQDAIIAGVNAYYNADGNFDFYSQVRISE